MEALASWVGRQERAHDDIAATPIAAHAALQSEPAVRVMRYEFKAIKPMFDTAPFYVCGRRDGARASLWIEDADGALCMDATAELG